MAPTVTSYDPLSPGEQPVPLPSAPLVALGSNLVLQPPLTRHGIGPGLIVFLPDLTSVNQTKSLDPEPVAKWAEEGFAVVGVTASEGLSVENALKQGLDVLQTLDQVDIQDKFGVIVYDSKLIHAVSEAASKEPRIAALVGYGSFAAPSCTIPILLHLTANAPRPAHPPSEVTKIWTYKNRSTSFVLPHSEKYDPGNAALAHSRTLVFLRKGLGGPFFDLEAIWDEHTYYEFEERSVAKTMGTMVAEPYVNHVPTMTGGIGRENLTAFYRDHFIFSNPADASLEVVSRTVGPDRVVDEFIYHLTHDKTVDWLLPQIPPTGKKLSIPMMAVVNIRGDRLYNEHIWWDQATALKQAGILPSHLPFSDPKTGATSSLRLPVVGVEGAEMLIDESKGKSNEMLDPGWATGNAA
ncbi:NTF2-like protein [Pholiota conissans]|uniref:NTF2-like protein n=1 Tax=Pholiota conissans TaxID=109636 RepID=A0A9P6CWL1_9AGAR|nr:NTF2-like protein [Pholiota conissans]